jgi:hypothetical protein
MRVLKSSTFQRNPRKQLRFIFLHKLATRRLNLMTFLPFVLVLEAG